MTDLERDTAYWRAKADEARAVADGLRDDEARKHMLAAAASYERLAKLAEHRPAKPTLKAANAS